MRPTRLLTVGHSYASAANRPLAHAIQAAAAGRWDVTLAAPTHFKGRRDLRPVTLKVGGAEPVPVAAIAAYGTGRVHTFVYGRALKTLLADGRFDVIHAWEEPYILAGAQVARWAPPAARFVFRTAQSLPKSYPPPFNWLERATVRRAAGWVCSGRLVEANLLARPGYADRPHLRAPLGVDTAKFRPDRAAGAAALARLGWAAAGPPVVGFVGRFVPEKGLPLLMRALPAVKSPWRALFVGNGPMVAEVEAWAAQRPDRVRVVTDAGPDAVPAYLNAMDLTVAPSQTTAFWKEQFGRMLVEAFAAGVPVIGSDSGEIPLVIRDTGDIVPEADEAAWVAAVGAMLDSPDRRRELAVCGRARAEAEFAWPVVGAAHVAFFDRLMDSQ